MFDIEVTPEKQMQYLDELSQYMSQLNDELPVLAGGGSFSEAMHVTMEEVVSATLALQRLWVMLSAIDDFYVAKMTAVQEAKKFEKTGGVFNGPASPTS